MCRRISNRTRDVCRDGVFVLLMGAICVGGCGPAVLSVDDAIVAPDGDVRLVARVEREPILTMRQDVEGVEVRFFVGDEEVGEDDTNEDGIASEKCELASPWSNRFEAQADVDGHTLYAKGRIFEWEPDRVIIAVDIDGTISETEHKELILETRDDESDPIKRSRKVLRRLAGDYQIVYVTARPRFLLDKTRAWLLGEEYPAGPVLTAPGLRQSFREVAYKRGALARLQKDWPMLLIGIGDKPTDAEAYGASKMLAVMVAEEVGEASFGDHAVVLPDWKSVDRFFEANEAVLSDGSALREVIRGKRMLLRPVQRFDDD